jgi:subtilisin family serine protease
MDILAPGLWISSSRVGGGRTDPGAGTSFAAPMAAGLAALMIQADPDLRPRDLEVILKDTGRAVSHPESGEEFPLIDAFAAVERVRGAVATPTATDTPSPTPTGQPTRTPTLDASPSATPTTVATERTSATPTPSSDATRPIATATGGTALDRVQIYLPRSYRP